MKTLRLVACIMYVIFLLIFTLFPFHVKSTLGYSEPLGLQDLISRSQWICLAQASKIRSYYQNDNRHDVEPIVSEIQFTNLKNYIGELKKHFSVHRLGGCVNIECLQVIGYKNLKAGDKVMLFLNKPEEKIKLADETYGIWKIDSEKEFLLLEKTLEEHINKYFDKN